MRFDRLIGGLVAVVLVSCGGDEFSAVQSGPTDAAVDSQTGDSSGPDAAVTDSSVTDSSADSGVLPDANSDTGTLPDATDDTGVLPDATTDTGVLPDATVDGGVDSGGDSGTGFDPGSVSSLLLWLDPKSGVAVGAAGVTSWTDKSKNHVAFVPTSAATVTREVEGLHTAMRFSVSTVSGGVSSCSGFKGLYYEETLLAVGTGEVAYFIVVKPDVVADKSLAGVLYKSDFNTAPFKGIQIFTNAAVTNTTVYGRAAGGLYGGFDDGTLISPTGNTRDGRYHLISVVRQSGVTYLDYDGKPAKKGAQGGNYDSSNPMFIGNRPNCLHPYSGLIGDVVVMKEVGAIVVGQVEKYLMTKYGIN